eukprot:1212416-Rhodomonas_salina.2
MCQVLSEEGWSVMEFIQHNCQAGFGRSGVEEANRLLSVWGVRNMPHCAFCNEGMWFIGFNVNHLGRLRFCWQCLPCTWKYNCIIESRAPALDPDEQPTVSDTPCLDIALLVPRDETGFLFAGPALSTRALTSSHLLQSPNVPSVSDKDSDPFQVSNATGMLHCLDKTPDTVEGAGARSLQAELERKVREAFEKTCGAVNKHPLAGFPSLFGDNDNEQPQMSQAEAVPVGEDQSLFPRDEPDLESTPPSYVGVLPWSEYIASVVAKLEPHFYAVVEDSNVLNLSAEMEVLCTQVPKAEAVEDDDDDMSTLSFSSRGNLPAKSQTLQELVESLQ